MTSTPSAQLRLPGQSDAPDGPVDLVMMFAMHHGSWTATSPTRSAMR